MPPPLPKPLIILLWYLGVMAPLPAPDGWKVFGNDRFRIHVPPGWEMVELESGTQPLAGFEPRNRFAARAPESEGWNVTFGKVPGAAKIGTRDAKALLSLEVDRPGMVARALQRDLPGWTCTVATTVYDQARHRLWFRIEARKPGEPPRAFVFVVFLLRDRAFYLEGTFPAEDGDEELLDRFRGVVNSFETEPAIRLREPAGPLSANPASSLRLGIELGRDYGRPHLKPFLAVLALGSLALLLTILDPLVFRRRLKAILLRRLQDSTRLRRPQVPVGAAARPPRLWLPPLPASLAWLIALAHLLPFAIIPWFERTPQIDGPRLFMACYLLGYGFFAAAVALHYLPRSSRRLKYDLLAFALATLALPGALVDPTLHAAAVGMDLRSLQGLFWGGFLSQAFYFYVAGVVAQGLLAGHRGAQRAARFYRATYWLKRYFLGLVAASAWFPVGGGLGFGFALLAVFYRIGEKARERPVLFLRSFHDAGATRVLAKIVMPTAGRFAPVLVVAHELQPAAELYRQTNLITAAQLTTLQEPHWQEWILASLPHCRAVLIDASRRTEGLLWELEQAQATLPAARIAVLAREETAVGVAPGVLVLRYRLGWRDRRKARKTLRAWLRALPP